MEEVAESDDEEKEDVKLISISGKHSAPGSGSKFPWRKSNLLLMKMMKMVIIIILMRRKLKKKLQ